MTRIAVIILIIVVGYWWLSRRRAGVKPPATPPTNDQQHASKNQAKQKTVPENLIQCAHCDVRIPKAHAVHHNGADYCSQAHAQADQSQ